MAFVYVCLQFRVHVHVDPLYMVFLQVLSFAYSQPTYFQATFLLFRCLTLFSAQCMRKGYCSLFVFVCVCVCVCLSVTTLVPLYDVCNKLNLPAKPSLNSNVFNLQILLKGFLSRVIACFPFCTAKSAT